MPRALPKAHFASMSIGALLWGLTAWTGGRSEPWDTPIFWTLAYPAAILISGGLGYAFPERPWRWAALVFAMLAVVMILSGLATGSGFSMMPPGFVLLAILALPAIGLAAVGGRFGRKRG